MTSSLPFRIIVLYGIDTPERHQDLNSSVRVEFVLSSLPGEKGIVQTNRHETGGVIMTQRQFSPWKPLNEENIKNVPDESGVYQIRCKGKPIERLLKSDEGGILDIGESGNLQHRLHTFFRCIRDPNRGGHSAGMRFAALKLSSNGFPKDDLEFRWKLTSSKKSARNEEKKLLGAYLRRFRELPPLNYKFGWTEYWSTIR